MYSKVVAVNPATGVVTSVSIAHDNATVDEIDAAATADQQAAVSALVERDAVDEAFVVQTCNRVEVYVVTDGETKGCGVLGEFAPDVRTGAFVKRGHEESLRHLMRVAAGLESLVLGEDQIIGQVRDAFSDAQAVGGIGPVLDEAVTKSLRVGERARTETAINEGSLSVGSAAAALVSQERGLDGSAALVVGAGEMGKLAAYALVDAGVESLVVANRSLPAAERLTETVTLDAARPVGLDALANEVSKADVVVSATGSAEYVIDADAVEEPGETFVVDIAQPRDVSPALAALDGVTVRDLDALESVTDETRARRQEAARTVEGIIDREFERLQEQYKRKRADEVIATMYESADRMKERELEVALSKLEVNGGFTDDQREVVSSLADALVSQLLAVPTSSLRDAAADDDWTTINTALQLFNPEFDGELPFDPVGQFDSASAQPADDD